MQIVEFFAISMLVIFAYLALSTRKKINPAMKGLASVLMGITLYVLAKAVITSLILNAGIGYASTSTPTF